MSKNNIKYLIDTYISLARLATDISEQELYKSKALCLAETLEEQLNEKYTYCIENVSFRKDCEESILDLLNLADNKTIPTCFLDEWLKEKGFSLHCIKVSKTSLVKKNLINSFSQGYGKDKVFYYKLID